MTAQIKDCYKYKDKEYFLVAISGEMGFNPKKYGITPMGRCTACYRGYWCEYEVTSYGLFLQNLYINSENGEYPQINGVDVSEVEYEECYSISWKGKKKIKKPIKMEKYYGHREYKNLNIPVDLTGKILLGSGFLKKYYVHMGFQQGWAYEELIEFTFDNGQLISMTNHSETAAKLRDIIDANETNPPYSEKKDIRKFVEDSFSLDYAVKAWWIEDKRWLQE